eukprot:29115-Pelagococcus_subviridis.AAC.2
MFPSIRPSSPAADPARVGSRAPRVPRDAARRDARGSARATRAGIAVVDAGVGIARGRGVMTSRRGRTDKLRRFFALLSTVRKGREKKAGAGAARRRTRAAHVASSPTRPSRSSPRMRAD